MRPALAIPLLLFALGCGVSSIYAADDAQPPANSFSDDQELIQAVDRLRGETHGVPDNTFEARLHKLAWSHLESRPSEEEEEEEEILAVQTLCEKSRPIALRADAIAHLSVLPSSKEDRRDHDSVVYVNLASDWLDQGARLLSSDPDKAKQYIIAGLVLASDCNLRSGLFVCHRAVAGKAEVATRLFADRQKELSYLLDVTQRQSKAARDDIAIFWPIAEALERMAKASADSSPDTDIIIVLDKLELLNSVAEKSVSRAWQIADVYRDVRRQAAGRASPAVVKRIDTQLGNQVAAAQSPDFHRWLSEAAKDQSARRTHAQIGGTEDGLNGP